MSKQQQQQQQGEGTAPKLHPRTPVSHPEKRDRELQQQRQSPPGDKQHHDGRQAGDEGHGPVRRQQTGQGLDADCASTGETGKRRDGQRKPVLRPR